MIKPLLLVFALSTLSLAAPTLGNAVIDRQTATETEYTNPDALADYSWSAGGVFEYPIHASCNHSEHVQLKQGLHEMIMLAQHAKDHILRFGNSSRHYTNWFGKAPTAGPIGWFDRVVNADRNGVLFRCDDADGNCAANPNWAGHWRGSNATQETVICERSFSGIRWPLAALCSRGYTVVNSPTSQFFAADLLHRVFHLPRISEGIVKHFAHDYPAMMDLAKTGPEEAVINSDTLQHFAVDVYAYDIASPNQGCTGKYEQPLPAPEISTSATSSMLTSTGGTSPRVTSVVATSPKVMSVVTTATSTIAPGAELASTVQSAASSCHTHADGFVHC